MYYNADGRLVSILASWTNVDEPDAFARAAAGRSWFRTDDLRQLRALIDELMADGGDHVKVIMPRQ